MVPFICNSSVCTDNLDKMELQDPDQTPCFTSWSFVLVCFTPCSLTWEVNTRGVSMPNLSIPSAKATLITYELRLC